MLILGKLRELLNDINYQLITDSKALYQPIEGTGKVDMLSTIVLSLLAVWLTILIACQIAGIVLGVKFFNAFNADEKDKS